MLKVLLLADISSEHTQKWALGLASKGIKVGLFSFAKSKFDWYSGISNVTVLYQPSKEVNSASFFTKLSYFKYTSKVKKAIDSFKPNLLHAHYATSYGLIGRLSGFHPLVISAWGTDVMRFPQQNAINKEMLKKNFEQADLVCATSSTIETYIKNVINKEVSIIPFGVDTDHFKPQRTASDIITIGCVKSLEKIYRIDVLIKAFGLIQAQIPNGKTKLLIVGSGSQELELMNLVNSLNLNDKVEFSGRVRHDEVPMYLNRMQIFANLSEYESFGVSVVEAMACACAVVVTDVGGLKEIVNSSDLGIRVEVDDVEATAAALYTLVSDTVKIKALADAGRAHVINNYQWSSNLDQMIKIYQTLKG